MSGVGLVVVVEVVVEVEEEVWVTLAGQPSE